MPTGFFWRNEMNETTQTTENTAVQENLSSAGKYLTFALENEQFGLEILKVREVIVHMNIRSVPKVPDFIKGVINLRSQVIPVVDLRSRFQMPEKEVTDETCIIVVQVNAKDRQYNTGIIVDRVCEVLDIKEEQIEDSPQFGNTVDTSFILGMAKVEDSVKILLNIDRVLEDTCLDGLSCEAE